jgi:hypothetical protein
MFWTLLFLLGVIVAVVYAVVWLALMAFLRLVSLMLVFVPYHTRDEASTLRLECMWSPKVGSIFGESGPVGPDL